MVNHRCVGKLVWDEATAAERTQLPATAEGRAVEMVDVWKETTMPPSRPNKEMAAEDQRPAMVSGFPPPPMLAADGHLVFGSAGGMQILPVGAAETATAHRPVDQRTQRKREKQQRKQLQKGECTRVFVFVASSFNRMSLKGRRSFFWCTSF